MNASKTRKLAGGLMVLSGFTHVAQLFVYEHHDHVVGAALFGVMYFLIGMLLLGRGTVGVWLGLILPSIGGTLGIHRFLKLQPNLFSIFHVSIDLVVVPICIWLVVLVHVLFVALPRRRPLVAPPSSPHNTLVGS